MSPRFVLGRENVPCVAEVVNRSLKADCTDFTLSSSEQFENQNDVIPSAINMNRKCFLILCVF